MLGKSLISEVKNRCPRRARDMLFLVVALLANACFIPPNRRPGPDGSVVPVYSRPPEVLASSPAEPLSDFEFARGTENCLFKISATLRDRDSEELDLRLVTDNYERYRRRADSRRIDVTQGETKAEFFVPYLSFGPTGTATTVAQHSISLFVSDAVDSWQIPDSQTVIGASGDDLGRLANDVMGNVIEVRWFLVFKDGCCPEDLQLGEPVACE